MRKAAVFVDHPVSAHKHVRDGGFTSRHAFVRPGGEMRHPLCNPYHAVVDHLGMTKTEAKSNKKRRGAHETRGGSGEASYRIFVAAGLYSGVINDDI